MVKIRPRFKTTSTPSAERRLMKVAAGELVFHRGDLGTEMFVIREGAVEIFNPNVDAEPLAVLEKGDFFGEMAILDGAPRTASARAAVDSTLVRIDETTFARLLRKDPEVAVRIMRKLSRRLRHVEELLAERGGVVPGSGPVETVASDVDPAAETAAGARLVHLGTGAVFPLLDEGTSLVGRRDPITGIKPTVDLTAIDPERSCSRQHARVFERDQSYFVAEDVGTTNGTFLNENRLGTGVPERLTNGDKVRFGLVTLEFSD